MTMAKPILDYIDVLLAWHYGLSGKELAPDASEFHPGSGVIINYDIKYRSPTRKSRFGDGAMGLTSPEATSAEGEEWIHLRKRLRRTKGRNSSGMNTFVRAKNKHGHLKPDHSTTRHDQPPLRR